MITEVDKYLLPEHVEITPNTVSNIHKN